MTKWHKPHAAPEAHFLSAWKMLARQLMAEWFLYYSSSPVLYSKKLWPSEASRGLKSWALPSVHSQSVAGALHQLVRVGLRVKVKTKNASLVFSLLFYCCNKTTAQRGKRTFHSTAFHHRPSLRKVRTGTQGRNLEAKTEVDTMEEHSLLAWSPWLTKPVFSQFSG